MANKGRRIMLYRVYFTILILFCTKCDPVLGYSVTEKSSLAFVIDRTYSMWDDIEQVKSAAKLIFNSVMNSDASHIGNFVLVTFGDPDITPAFITTEKDQYINVLNDITLKGNQDCPEMSIKGIEEALIKSNPRSYIFVFTDASAKDHLEAPRIKSIAQKKLSQIVFVLTGVCGCDNGACSPENDPAYLIYHTLATATSGQVFHLEKNEVNKILAYAAELVKAPRNVIGEHQYDPGYGKTFNFTTDSKMKDLIMSVSGSNPSAEVLKPDGTKAPTSEILKTTNAMVIKVTLTAPGTHLATVGSGSKTKALLTGATTFNFKHGFSFFKPASIEDTKPRPIAGKLPYLAINTNDPANDVELKEINLVDTSNNILQVLPLEKIDNNFYVAKIEKPLNTMFKILVKGIIKTTEESIERFSITPIEPQTLMDEGPPVVKAPTISSIGDTLQKVNYGNALELRCKVNGYPKPRITWIEEKSGSTVSEMVEEIDLPYDYVSVLSIEQVKTNTSYQCRAFNDYGEDKKAVTVEAITKFVAVNISKDTGILYKNQGKLNCLIDSNPLSNVNWYRNGVRLDSDKDIEISSDGSILKVLNMQPKIEGKYDCEVVNEVNRQLYTIHLTVQDKALPKIHETPSEAKVRRDKSVDLNCKVTEGIPPPSMRWFFKQENTSDFVQIGETSEVLHIPQARLDNVGVYQCEAFNDYGKITKTINLAVEYPPTIKDDINIITIKEGNIVYLNCVVDGLPPPSVRWTFNGDIVKTSGTREILRNNTLRYKAAITNAGDYTCEAVNKHGSVIKTIQVVVYVPPKLKNAEHTLLKKLLGSSITLRCEASGFPNPSVEWLFSNNKRETVLRPTDSSGSLHLPRLQTSESGRYICVAKNIVGSANLTYSVEAIVKAPTIASVGDTIKKVNYGDALELRCKVNGFPKPSINWIEQKSGRKMSERVEDVDLPYDYVSTLRIQQAKTNTSYQCEAFNDYGKDRKAVTVEVITKFVVVNISKDISILYGDEGNLTCLIDSNPRSIITWWHNGAPVSDDDDDIEISEYIEGSVLQIIRMQPRDEGKYTCEVQNKVNRQLFTMQVTMSDKASPIIRKTAHKITVRRDESVDLDCTIIKGVPQPIMRWFFKQENTSHFVEIDEISDVLHIPKANLGNVGTYMCEAFNEYGKDRKKLYLAVEYPPTIKEDKKLITIEDGKNVYLACEVDGLPQPSVYWKFNGDVVENSVTHKIFRNNTLRYKAVISNAGAYTCTAVNKLGSTEKTVKVIVYVAPKLKIPEETTLKGLIGTSKTLRCQASGFPEPSVEWLFFRDGTKTVLRPTDSSGSLHLPRLQYSESGYYVCLAKNSEGSANLTYSVDVQVPPSIKKTRNPLTAVIGDLLLELPCQAFGHPKPTITWMKNGVFVSTGTDWHDIKADGTLIIKKIDELSGGPYVCEASNEVNNAFQLIRVKVLKFPKPVLPAKNINIELGKPAVIKCDVPHKPTDVLKWYKGSRLLATGELILNDVQMSDGGLYTCRVNSFSGVSSASVSVNVKSKPMFLHDEEENQDFSLNSEARLSCEAQGEPFPTVSWKHNGIVLDENQMTHVFTMLESNVGRYTCVVSNMFGTISRNFNIVNKDCSLKRSDKVDSPTITYFDVRSLDDSIDVQVPKGETVTFSCPGEFISFPGNKIEATCVQGTTVEINEQLIDASEIKCNIDSMRPVIKQLNYACGPGHTQNMKVGYEDDGKFIETYDICYDLSNAMPLYSTHRISSSLSKEEPRNAIKWFENEFVPYNYNDLYNCEDQKETLSSYLKRNDIDVDFNDVGNCCFARKQLVNPRDVTPGLPQMVTYSNLNVVPHWSTCNSQNWDEVERRVRSLSEQANHDLIIHTGIAPDPFKYNNMFLVDKDNKWQMVPTYLWKVVEDDASKSSLAIIQVNVPYLTESQKFRYIRCRDICQYIPWLKDLESQNLEKGFTYCCSVQKFEKGFGYNKIFSSRNKKILFNV